MDSSLKARLTLLCADIGTPFAAKVANLLEQEKWDDLVALEVNPRNYGSRVSDYKADVGLAALFVKNTSIPAQVDTKAVALKKWWSSEHLCAQTNARFSNYLQGYYPGVDWRVVEFLHRVQKRVAGILGPLPSSLRGRMGPGSTFEAPDMLGDVVRSLTTVDKVQATAGTAAAIELTDVPALQDRFTAPWKFGDSRRITDVRGSRWACVPKTALTDRAIALEPGLNIYLQLGVEERLWACLNKVGIYKATAQKVHRTLAKQALDLGLATLDESMASDLWAANAVRFLLARSPLWLGLLEQLRCRFMRVNGNWVFLEKFSSMGNGFTFPLETILFYAVTRELCGDEATVSVFGDDIICPSDRAVDVMSGLRFFGHKPNESKSFYEGLFRESCGEDFLAGEPVRPHYLDKWPTEPLEWYALANGLRKRASSSGHLKFRLWVIRQIPLAYRFGGPEYLGDSVIHGFRARTRTQYWIRQVRGLKYVGREIGVGHFSGQDVLTSLLMGKTLIYKSVSRNSRKGGKSGYVSTRGVSGWKPTWLTSF